MLVGWLSVVTQFWASGCQVAIGENRGQVEVLGLGGYWSYGETLATATGPGDVGVVEDELGRQLGLLKPIQHI